MKKLSRTLIAVFALMLSIVGVINYTDVSAKAKAKLNKTSVTVKVGKTVKLKMKNISKSSKVTWKSDNKEVATVSKAGKVKGKAEGVCTITATVDKLNCYSCRVVVTPKKTTTDKNKETDDFDYNDARLQNTCPTFCGDATFFIPLTYSYIGYNANKDTGLKMNSYYTTDKNSILILGVLPISDDEKTFLQTKDGFEAFSSAVFLGMSSETMVRDRKSDISTDVDGYRATFSGNIEYGKDKKLIQFYTIVKVKGNYAIVGMLTSNGNSEIATTDIQKLSDDILNLIIVKK